MDKNNVRGIICMDMATGDIHKIRSDHVIIATGGWGKNY